MSLCGPPLVPRTGRERREASAADSSPVTRYRGGAASGMMRPWSTSSTWTCSLTDFGALWWTGAARRSAKVGPFTWRDEQAQWPQPLETDRTVICVPESLGFRLGHDEDELEIVVWTGGWADIDRLLGGEVTSLCPEFLDVDEAYAAVVSNVEDFLA